MAFPATGLPGAFFAPMFSNNAASNCNSPSIFKSDTKPFTFWVASITLSASSCLALPFVEKDNIATMGSSPTNLLCVKELLIAILASCSASGLGITAQSPKVYSRPSGITIIKQLETAFIPGATPTT